MRSPKSKSLILLAFALAIGAAGCASSGSSSRPAGATSSRIVKEELQGLGQINALEAVERLRPQWFRARVGADPPVLYVDGTRRGSSSDLAFLRIENIEQMEYMGASDATTRFGTGHGGGAIMVTSVR